MIKGVSAFLVFLNKLISYPVYCFRNQPMFDQQPAQQRIPPPLPLLYLESQSLWAVLHQHMVTSCDSQETSLPVHCLLNPYSNSEAAQEFNDTYTWHACKHTNILQVLQSLSKQRGLHLIDGLFRHSDCRPVFTMPSCRSHVNFMLTTPTTFILSSVQPGFTQLSPARDQDVCTVWWEEKSPSGESSHSFSLLNCNKLQPRVA